VPAVKANSESNQKKLTTEPVQAGDTSDAQVEWIRLKDLKRLFGIGKSYAYGVLIPQGHIKSVCLRQPGAKTGLRLIHAQSVRDFLNAQLGDQQP
jgi:hypothetical protein